MTDKFEKILKLLSDTQNITPNDNLSEYIENYYIELSEEDLEYVSAATKSDYNRLLEYMKNKEK